ncbi:Hypothetical protein I595_903 [Croceitalea dokdonensis DOKDO 023]|uniref:Secreted protein n=1 Tax=Croceitalea dokdonensis DOKDO 023 TaxID=1300341 RepID=A0A0P7A6U9_9FLAO|nr:hypothetical protein [Croceitalea dokdonensis]KPM32485.1 Hypothetical protein I595_903 [Croceitalea dokdonensis DOKDO 023]
MKSILLFFCVFSMFLGEAQYSGQFASSGSAAGNANGLGQLEQALGPINERNSKTAKKMETIQGSPYTSNTFLPGNVYYKEENTGSVFYRYNAYNEEIEIKTQNLEDAPIRGLSRDKNIAVIGVDGRQVRFSTFIDKRNRTQNGYLTLVQDGKFKLYERNNIKYTEGQPAPNPFIKAVPPKFSQFKEYYLEIEGNNRVDEVELKNKKLLKLLPADMKVSTQQYLKENKIKIKDIEDLMAVVTYLNQ